MADNYWGNLARAGLGQGLAMGWGDELEAKIRTLSGDETYQEELAMINADYNQFNQDNPYSAGIAEIGGSLVPTAVAALGTPFTGGGSGVGVALGAGRIANAARKIYNNPFGRGITEGVTTGAISGAGTADEGERLYGAGIGSLFGLAAGTALPLIGRGGESALKLIKDRATKNGDAINEGALRRIYKKISQSGGTIEDFELQYQRDRNLGVPVTLGQYNPSTVNLMDTLAATDVGSDVMEAQLLKTQLEVGDRVNNLTRKYVSSTNYVSEADSISDALRLKAKGLYDDAYRFGTVTDPKVLATLVNNKSFKNAFAKAQSLAATQKDTARGQAALDGLPFDESKFDLIPYDIEAGIFPDLRTLDYVKRAIDDEIDAGFKSKAGSLSSAEATALKDLRNVWVKLLDNATEDQNGVSAYRKARQEYAGDMEVKDALKLGREEFRSLDPEEIVKKFDTMSEAEKNAFRVGASRHLLDIVNDTSGNANFAQRIIGSNNTKDSILAMFPGAGKEGVALYQAALLREAQLFKEIGGTLTGSRTAKRLSGAETLEEGDGALDKIALGIGSLDSQPTSWVSNFLTGAKGASEGMKKRMSEMLMSDNPEDVASVMKALKEYKASIQPSAMARDLSSIEKGIVRGAAQTMDIEQGTSMPEGERAANMTAEALSEANQAKIDNAANADVDQENLSYRERFPTLSQELIDRANEQQ
tara:strand:- start:193 stop:2304 length:2112 start_codon:yes stop_codon:yes gene_type:complete